MAGKGRALRAGADATRWRPPMTLGLALMTLDGAADDTRAVGAARPSWV